MDPSRTEAEIHQLFDVTLVLKGLHALIEMIGGILLYAVSAENIVRIVNFFVRDEIREDPHDFIANYLLHTAQNFGGSTQAFAALYLLLHGIINGSLVVALWKEKLWAYPVAFVVIGAFIVYQLYLFIFGFSWWLALLTALDIVVIFLVRHEYGVLKARAAARNAATDRA
jgi:uncharacterized membrane protein